MPFGIIGGTGPRMRQVVGFGDRSPDRGTFGGEFGARHCNKWGLYDVCVRQRRDAAFSPNYSGQTCSCTCIDRFTGTSVLSSTSRLLFCCGPPVIIIS